MSENYEEFLDGGGKDRKKDKKLHEKKDKESDDEKVKDLKDTSKKSSSVGIIIAIISIIVILIIAGFAVYFLFIKKEPEVAPIPKDIEVATKDTTGYTQIIYEKVPESVRCPGGSIAKTFADCPRAKFRCPDGSFVYNSLTECRQPTVNCNDGTRVYSYAQCSDPKVLCPDGVNTVHTIAMCPPISDANLTNKVKPTIECASGLLVFEPESCYPENIICADGKTRVFNKKYCPAESVVCPDKKIASRLINCQMEECPRSPGVFRFATACCPPSYCPGDNDETEPK